MKLAIQMDAKDNVAMAMEALTEGETISVLSDQAIEIDRVRVTSDVPLPFHKIALAEIGRGQAVFKYGEIVGYATTPIARGDWVHLHNLESAHFREGDAVRSEAHG